MAKNYPTNIPHGLPLIVTTRAFISCKECNRDMRGVVFFEHDAEDFWHEAPTIICMKCYYKDEIAKLKKE